MPLLRDRHVIGVSVFAETVLKQLHPWASSIRRRAPAKRCVSLSCVVPGPVNHEGGWLPGLAIIPARLTNDASDYARVQGACQPQKIDALTRNFSGLDVGD